LTVSHFPVLFAKVNGKDVLWSTYTLKVFHFRKLFQACKSAAEELFRADRVNELHRNLREVSSASSSGEL
jgi:hypothetical protein